jgi:Tol biopolymer transport system component
MSSLPTVLARCAGFLLLTLSACREESSVEPAGSGSMVVVVQTSGPGMDPDGYTLVLDDTASHSLPVAGSTTLTDLSVGEHALELTGLSTNCSPVAALPPSVTIAVDADATVHIDVTCTKLLPYDLAYQYAGDIYLLPATGGPPLQLTRDSISYRPTWSPDGRRLAFEKLTGSFPQGRAHDLYVMNVDGTDILQLTSGTDLGDTQPEWSPDGSLILFSRRMVLEGGTDLYTIRPDGSDLRNLTTGAGYEDDHGAWSPDGRQIAFVSDRRGTVSVWGGVINELHVMNVDGSRVRPLGGDGMEWRGNHLGPEWSPDGSRIVFWTVTGFGIRLFEEAWSYQINADGTNLIELGAYHYGGPRWSPDGSQILMTESRSHPTHETARLVVRGVSSGDVRPLHPVDSQFHTESEGVWSPDGELIAFCDGRYSNTQYEPLYGMFVIAPDGTGLAEVLPYCARQLAWRPSVP